MKDFFKAIIFSILIFSCIFLLSGCNNKVKKSTKSLFDLEQVTDKIIKVNLENAKKGDEKNGKIIIGEGEDIIIKSKLEGTAGVNIYYFKVGSKHDKSASDYELINGEGESKTEDFPAGEYEVVFEIMDDGVTGNIELGIK